MGLKTFTIPLVTKAPPNEIMDAIVNRLRPFGGQIQPGPNMYSFIIHEGNVGITGSFLMEISAQISLTHQGGDTYLITCSMNKEPSGIFWVFLGCGILFTPLWIGNLVYLFIEPEKDYSNKLENIGYELACRMGGVDMNMPPKAPQSAYPPPHQAGKPPQAPPSMQPPPQHSGYPPQASQTPESAPQQARPPPQSVRPPPRRD